MTPLNAHERAEMHALIESEWPKLERFFRSKVPPGEIQDLAMQRVRPLFASLPASPSAYSVTVRGRRSPPSVSL